MTKARDVVEAFKEATLRRGEEQRARMDYQGYSWGYVGADLIAAADEAEERAEEVLREFVNEQIDARMENVRGA